MATAQTRILNTKDLMAAFGVGHMTIYNWRHDETDPLPCEVAENGRVSFKENKVVTWAKKWKVEYTPPKKLVGEAKPGPKAKVAPARKVAGGERAVSVS